MLLEVGFEDLLLQKEDIHSMLWEEVLDIRCSEAEKTKDFKGTGELELVEGGNGGLKVKRRNMMGNEDKR